MKLPWWITRWLDPDHNWASPDKYRHGAASAGVAFLSCVLLSTLFPFGVWQIVAMSFLWCVTLGWAWEGGQADTANAARLLGRVGFGIGLLDVVWNMAGTVAGILLWLLARAVL